MRIINAVALEKERKKERRETGSCGRNKMGANVLDLKGLFFKNVSL